MINKIKYDICVDFDGTVVYHMFPEIGNPVPNALKVLNRIQEAGHNIILFTMRSGQYLEDAVNYLNENGINLYGTNVNPTQHNWTSSPKAYGQIYIDDAALGAPVIEKESQRPYVNWVEVEKILEEKEVL